MKADKRGREYIEVNFQAKIAVIDSGSPKTAYVDVKKISSHNAVIQTSHILQLGEKIGFLLEGPDIRVSRLFSTAGMAAPYTAIITQAKVDELLEAQADVNARKWRIRFVGNMRFIESGDMAQPDN